MSNQPSTESTPGSQTSPLTKPWEALRVIVDSGAGQDVAEFLDTLPTNEAARAISRLSDDDQVRLLTSLPPERAAELLDGISDAQAIELIDLLPAADAAAIVNELGSDEQADLLSELDRQDAEAILAAMDPVEAANARRLARYDAGTAGGLMITEYLCYCDDQTVADVLADLREHAEEYAHYDVQYAYVVRRRRAGSPAGGAASRAEGSPGVLLGVLRLRDLLLGPAQRRISDLMIRDPLSVSVDARLDDLASFFDRHQFFGVPVVDGSHQLLGVVRRQDVEEALADRADTYYLKLQGIIGGEELRTMPLVSRAGRRLAWLAANVLLNLVAVSVIAVYEETLAQVIALAIFLPLISDMGGNAGVQAIGVSIRELTLGLLKPHELMWVAMKESTVGVCNGVILGILVGVAGWIWQENAFMGLVVGTAMALNTVVATVVGGAMPLILSRLRMDPALASGPILTTITDMSGFFFVLSLATAALPRLIG